MIKFAILHVTSPFVTLELTPEMATLVLTVEVGFEEHHDLSVPRAFYTKQYQHDAQDDAEREYLLRLHW